MKPMERFAFRVGDVFARRLQWLSNFWINVVLTVVAWVCVGRRLRLDGVDTVKLDKKSRAIIVANHRSFFDFFVVAAVLRWQKKSPRRILFPVRANFFYDHILGTFINLAMSGMSMFPPIFRDPKRSRLNKFAVARTVSELQVEGTLVGMHPEGTRNKGDDPYRFLPAQPGVGRIVLAADDNVQIVPCYILGMTNSLGREFINNWRRPQDHPIWVVFGEEVEVDDLKREGSRPATNKRASDRCLSKIAELAEKQRALAGAPTEGIAEDDVTPQKAPSALSSPPAAS